MELTGTIKKISDLQTFASGFQKKELVLLLKNSIHNQLISNLLRIKWTC